MYIREVQSTQEEQTGIALLDPTGHIIKGRTLSMEVKKGLCNGIIVLKNTNASET